MPPSKATILAWLDQMIANPPEGVASFAHLAVYDVRNYMTAALGPYFNEKEIGDHDQFNAWLQDELDARK